MPPARFLQGDGRDVSKIKALKEVAEVLKRRGSMLYGEAARRVWASRAGFYRDLARRDLMLEV